jgi:hypothetical protein
LMTIVFGVGQAAGPFFAGRVADAAQTFSPAFVIAGAIAIGLGATGSWLLPKTRERPGERN